MVRLFTDEQMDERCKEYRPIPMRLYPKTLVIEKEGEANILGNMRRKEMFAPPPATVSSLINSNMIIDANLSRKPLNLAKNYDKIYGEFIETRDRLNLSKTDIDESLVKMGLPTKTAIALYRNGRTPGETPDQRRQSMERITELQVRDKNEKERLLREEAERFVKGTMEGAIAEMEKIQKRSPDPRIGQSIKILKKMPKEKVKLKVRPRAESDVTEASGETQPIPEKLARQRTQ